MIRTAVDTSSLLDLFSTDFAVAERTGLALMAAAREGDLIVCAEVLAELGPALKGGSVQDFAEKWDLQFVASNIEVAELASKQFATYISRGGKRGRVVMDFLIGAHAMLLADRLMTKDKGFERDYFGLLQVISA